MASDFNIDKSKVHYDAIQEIWQSRKQPDNTILGARVSYVSYHGNHIYQYFTIIWLDLLSRPLDVIVCWILSF